ncbi:RIP metalloprotease RseP [Enterobacteriaceae endosymbiont of Donacia tomentosa]|uniref:RIP metalloprotease RseP n=1 Tax=Enterobacteriaceae endosymbiont of Donacia tomentosa TaxID=2675787 RepID=UPI001449FDDD|nr:RIP metalloprotease RseP [Enterobacteriaceae endosymbiont of Donacia tomentosa]QJC31664.1 RIP metalloprotease RseP [Enterobacteriaceae endosymbiont of Donacia tomentosa]
MLLNILFDIIIFIITVSSLIIVHECGHFYMARLFRTYIKCFSIGFGKKILNYHDKYGTNYVVRVIPLGGYVKISSNVDNNNTKYVKKFNLLLYDQLSFFKKILIIIGGPIANIIFAIIIYWIIFFIGIRVPIKYPIINEINYLSVADLAGLAPNMEIKKINGVNTPDWNTVNSELIKNIDINQNNKIKIEVSSINSNIRTNKILKIPKNSIKYLKKQNLILKLGIIPKGLKINPIIAYVIHESPAAKSKLHIGDKIINVQGSNFSNWYDLQKFIFSNTDKVINLNIKRNNKYIDIKIIPSIISVVSKKTSFIGLIPKITNIKDTSIIIHKYNFVQALYQSIKKIFKLIQSTLSSLYGFFKKKQNMYNLNGPISIGQIAGILIRSNFVYYFMFLALVNINLSIINLLPIPILDGGQLVLLCCEKIIGRKISNKIKYLTYKLSLIILILIMGIALINDFLRL